jgi:tripartite-type tricarboxylate transporter receptor subunit TctC
MWVYCATGCGDDSTKPKRWESALRAIVRLLVGLMLAVPAAASAQTYPDRNVRVLVPFGQGGPTDVIARVFAAKLSENLGHTFYVENVPGAGGNIGTAQAARAPADGYTILVVSTGFMVNPSLYPKVPYDPVKDFTPLTLAAVSPNVLFVNPSVPAKTLKELIDLVKSNPGKYSYAQPAIGSTPHLSAELLKLTFGLDLVMVPFTSAGLAVNGVLSGQPPIGCTALPPTIGLINEGKLRGLAVMATKRAPTLPNVPTIAEAGVPGQEAETVTGFVLPARTPPAIVEKLHSEMVKIGALPEIRERLEAIGFTPVLDTPAEFGERIKAEMEKWGKVVRDSNLKIQ